MYEFGTVISTSEQLLLLGATSQFPEYFPIYVLFDSHYHLLQQSYPQPSIHVGPFISQQTGCTDFLLKSVFLRCFLHVNKAGIANGCSICLTWW